MINEMELTSLHCNCLFFFHSLKVSDVLFHTIFVTSMVWAVHWNASCCLVLTEVAVNSGVELLYY